MKYRRFAICLSVLFALAVFVTEGRAQTSLDNVLEQCSIANSFSFKSDPWKTDPGATYSSFPQQPQASHAAIDFSKIPLPKGPYEKLCFACDIMPPFDDPVLTCMCVWGEDVRRVSMPLSKCKDKSVIYCPSFELKCGPC
jgi:hypothetical protein